VLDFGSGIGTATWYAAVIVYLFQKKYSENYHFLI
jgi:hypothetical protein